MTLEILAPDEPANENTKGDANNSCGQSAGHICNDEMTHGSPIKSRQVSSGDRELITIDSGGATAFNPKVWTYAAASRPWTERLLSKGYHALLTLIPGTLSRVRKNGKGKFRLQTNLKWFSLKKLLSRKG